MSRQAFRAVDVVITETVSSPKRSTLLAASKKILHMLTRQLRIWVCVPPHRCHERCHETQRPVSDTFNRHQTESRKIPLASLHIVEPGETSTKDAFHDRKKDTCEVRCLPRIFKAIFCESSVYNLLSTLITKHYSVSATIS